MKAANEAIYLPSLFLTVTLLGGVRPGAAQVVAAPSLFSLVLGVLLIGVLVQSGALAPDRLLHRARTPIANLNGLSVLLTCVAAGAQIFSLLMPQAGLPRVFGAVYFLVLLLNTAAARPDRVRVLRSLAVTFGAAFIVKFVVLDAISGPATGRLARVLQVLLEGMTLGTVSQEVQPPAAGYVAFLVLVLFLVGVWMLPRRPRASMPLDRLLLGD